MSNRPFKLSDTFIEPYKTKEPEWGPLGEVTYLRTYSRKVDANTPQERNEEWWETVRRVVEGTFNIQKEHVQKLKLPWYNDKAQRSAQKMYEKIFDFKFLPPGRGLWMMGTDFVKERGSAALNNCAFISTEDIATRGSFAFEWTMDALMVGVGVGFDAKGAGHLTLHEPKDANGTMFRIPDSREGWVESLGVVLNAYFKGNVLPEMDYSLIRPEGAPIKGFGGVASGPAPLKNLHEQIQKLFKDRAGTKITSVDIVDVMNMIGACVVAGNVRRSAEISFGFPDDHDFVTMKDYNKHPEEVMSHRWASNNSVFAEVGKTDYGPIAESIALNGEPGLIWLDNMQKYGRLKDGITWADRNVAGSNPCKPLYSKILTDQGYVTFEQALEFSTLNVVIGGEVIEATKPFKTGENRIIYAVKLSNGSHLYGTEDHLHQTTDNEWKRMDELVVGDRLKYEVDSVHFDTEVSSQEEYNDGILTGWLWGDGSMFLRSDGYGYGFSLSFGVNEQDVIPMFEETYGIKTVPHHQKPDTCRIFSSHKKTFPEKVLSYGYDMDKSNLEWLYSTSKDFKIGFIRAALTTDGSVRPRNNTVELYSIHRDSLEVLSDIFREFGIYTNVTTHSLPKSYIAKDGKRRNNKLVSKLVVYGTSFSKFGFLSKYKQDRLLELIDRPVRIPKDYVTVMDIDSEYDVQDVYDITVKSDEHSFIDSGVVTHNCSEQTLESGELCCLVETFPSRHDSYEEYKETMKYAYLYGKTVTLLPTHWEETNAVLMKNRRIGTSQSGIIDAFVKHGRRTMIEWSDNLYSYLRELDKKYADWLAIPQSIKVTSVKPSGSVSLLPGVSPGIHYPHDQYYVRRIRIPSENPLIPILREAGYEMEPNAYGSTTLERNKTMVVSFPVYEPFFEKRKDDVSIWEQMKNLVDYQNVWADNAVSITVTFKSGEADQIASVLEAYEDQLKAVSFLPISEHGYKQAPYETITKERYEEMASKITKPDFTVMTGALTAKGSVFCDGDSCEI